MLSMHLHIALDLGIAAFDLMFLKELPVDLGVLPHFWHKPRYSTTVSSVY
jgi:hypothetical protein